MLTAHTVRLPHKDLYLDLLAGAESFGLVSASASPPGSQDKSLHAELLALAFHSYMLSLLSAPLAVVSVVSAVQQTPQRRRAQAARVLPRVPVRKSPEPAADEHHHHASSEAPFELNTNAVWKQQQEDMHSRSDLFSFNARGKIPPLVAASFLQNLRTVIAARAGGYAFLLRGHLTRAVYHVAHSLIEPLLEETLNDTFDVFEDLNPATFVVSHAAVGVMLLPLEELEVRMITAAKPKYYSPIDGLYALYDSRRALYSSRLIIPTTISHALAAGVRIAAYTLITETLGVTIGDSPLLFRALEVLAIAAETLVTLPFEVARARLMVAFTHGDSSSSSTSFSQDDDLVVDRLPCTGYAHALYDVLFVHGDYASCFWERLAVNVCGRVLGEVNEIVV